MNQGFREFFASLNAHGVEFLVLGGVAYNFYAPPRATKDIDIRIRPPVENATQFFTALTAFGFSHQLDASQFAERNKVLMLGLPPNRIDVLTAPTASRGKTVGTAEFIPTTRVNPSRSSRSRT